jgi:hypothetical protein
MRAALWTVRILIATLCILDVWLLVRALQYGPGLLAQSASGESIQLLPVQWAAAGFLWLGALISLQLLLIAAEMGLRVRLRRRPPLAAASPSR